MQTCTSTFVELLLGVPQHVQAHTQTQAQAKAHVRTAYHNHNVEEFVAGSDVRQRQTVSEANIGNHQKVHVALVGGHDHDRNIRRSFVHLHHFNEKIHFLCVCVSA